MTVSLPAAGILCSGRLKCVVNASAAPRSLLQRHLRSARRAARSGRNELRRLYRDGRATGETGFAESYVIGRLSEMQTERSQKHKADFKLKFNLKYGKAKGSGSGSLSVVPLAPKLKFQIEIDLLYCLSLLPSALPTDSAGSFEITVPSASGYPAFFKSPERLFRTERVSSNMQRSDRSFLRWRTRRRGVGVLRHVVVIAFLVRQWVGLGDDANRMSRRDHPEGIMESSPSTPGYIRQSESSINSAILQACCRPNTRDLCHDIGDIHNVSA